MIVDLEPLTDEGQNMAERVRVGMIGLRGWGNLIREGMVQAGNLELAVAASQTPESIERVKQQWPKVEIVPTFEDLLKRRDIVGIVSNMPNPQHVEHIVKAAAAGKHLFVEKPVTNTIAEAKEALAAVEKSGIICQVGHNDRMHPIRRRMKQIIQSGRLGRLFAVEGNQSHRGGLRPVDPKRIWRRNPESCPAVPLMQLGVHLIDTANYLLDRRALRVTAIHRNLVMENDASDVTTQVIEYPDNILFTLTSYYITNGTHFLNVFGTEANLYARDVKDGTELTVRTQTGDEVETAAWGPTPGYHSTTDEMREFGECLRTGRQPEVTVRVALDALAPIEAAIRSSREGRTVELAELGV
jgi:predicted dehydrogenase